jgi:hypothetical protein
MSDHTDHVHVASERRDIKPPDHRTGGEKPTAPKPAPERRDLPRPKHSDPRPK